MINVNEIVGAIVEAIDESTMLGASWDCLSTEAKERFKLKLSRIVEACNANQSLS